MVILLLSNLGSWKVICKAICPKICVFLLACFIVCLVDIEGNRTMRPCLSDAVRLQVLTYLGSFFYCYLLWPFKIDS